MTTNKDLLDIPEDKRKCRFAEEGHHHYPDSMFNLYSQSACIFECRLRQTYSKVGCLKWDFPHFEDPISVCDDYSKPPEEPTFDKVFGKMSSEECNCPADCEITSYTKDISKKEIDVSWTTYTTVISVFLLAYWLFVDILQECFVGHDREVRPMNAYFKFINNAYSYNFDEWNDDCKFRGWSKLLTKWVSLYFCTPQYFQSKCTYHCWKNVKCRVKIQMDTSAVTRTRRIRRTTITDQIANLGKVQKIYQTLYSTLVKALN